uniref:Porin family protein n=1 Tax=Roseihalotalea indica TaxID=2867963 RepID=A0AA49GQ90_9BACT|nr:porin family protein [Tunicatimonas sp. TK19036]
MPKKLYLLLIVICYFTVESHAQKSKHRPGGFTSSQWYIGVTSGISKLQPKVLESHSEVELWDYNELETKEYPSADQSFGYHLGVATHFSPTRFLQISLTPSYVQQDWSYRTQYRWENSENFNYSFEMEYQHQYTLHYLVLPLSAKYIFLPRRWKPFIQAGIQYQRTVDATKHLISSGTDYTSGAPVSLASETQSTTATSLFNKNQWAAKAGGGLYYHFTGFMVGIEVSHYYGLSNIVNDQERYSATRDFQGLGTVLDDIRLVGKEVSFQLVFPMKYLTKSFSPVVL